MTYCGKYILDENGDQKSFFPQEVCKKSLLLNSVAQILRVHLRPSPRLTEGMYCLQHR